MVTGQWRRWVMQGGDTRTVVAPCLTPFRPRIVRHGVPDLRRYPSPSRIRRKASTCSTAKGTAAPGGGGCGHQGVADLPNQRVESLPASGHSASVPPGGPPGGERRIALVMDHQGAGPGGAARRRRPPTRARSDRTPAAPGRPGPTARGPIRCRPAPRASPPAPRPAVSASRTGQPSMAVRAVTTSRVVPAVSDARSTARSPPGR